MYICEHCHNNSRDRESIYDTTTMAGGYQTHLCIACKNAFHVYMGDHPAFHKLQLSEVALAGAVQANQEDRFEALLRQVTKNKKILYHLSAAWVAGQGEAATEVLPQQPPTPDAH